MTRARRQIKKWGYIVTVSLLGAGIVIEAAFLYPVVQRQAGYAEAGRAARARQIRVMPVSCKEHVDAWRRGVITRADLQIVACPIR